MLVSVKLPKLGETVEEVVVLQWLVAVGDAVEREQDLVEVETDKVQTEVPSPVAGTVVRLLVAPDDEVATGTAICEIETADGA